MMKSMPKPMREPAGWTAPLLLIVLGLLSLVLMLFAYAFLHEAGHALAGWLFGQSLTDFTIDLLRWDAHVGMAGSLTRSQEALQSVAGTALPLLLWFVGMSLVPRKASFTVELLKLLSSMIMLGTLLPWIVLPILYVFGSAPPSDDVTNFLEYSRISPWLLALLAALMVMGSVAFFLSRIGGLQEVLLLFRLADPQTLAASARRSLPAIVGALAVVLLLSFVFGQSAERNPQNALSPPAGFVSVARVDLSGRAYSAEALAEFSVDKRAVVGVYVIVQDIDTTYFDLTVMGPNGYSSLILHGEEYKAARDGGLWKQNLPPGAYQVVLTSHQSPGSVSLYLSETVTEE